MRASRPLMFLPAMVLLLQADGKIVVAGESDIGGTSKIAVARFNSNGRADTTFGGGDGFTLTSFGNQRQAANAVVVTPDGNIAVAGFTSAGTNARSAMVRYGPGVNSIGRSAGTGACRSTSAAATNSSRPSPGTARTTGWPATPR